MCRQSSDAFAVYEVRILSRWEEVRGCDRETGMMVVKDQVKVAITSNLDLLST